MTDLETVRSHSVSRPLARAGKFTTHTERWFVVLGWAALYAFTAGGFAFLTGALGSSLIISWLWDTTPQRTTSIPHYETMTFLGMALTTLVG